MWFGVWNELKTISNFQLFSLTATSPALPRTTIYRSDTTRVSPQDVERRRPRLGTRQDDEKSGLRDVHDVSQAWSKFFFYFVFLFLTFLFLATDYDYDNADMDGATRDVEQHKDDEKMGLRDVYDVSQA